MLQLCYGRACVVYVSGNDITAYTSPFRKGCTRLLPREKIVETDHKSNPQEMSHLETRELALFDACNERNQLET
jgi:hypothetical protein